MGTSAQSNMNSTSFFKTFRSQFRPLEIKGEKIDGQVYVCDANQEMIIEYPNRILDQESDELWHQSQSMIQHIQAPYIINYYGSAERQSQEMCSSYSTIFSYYEYIPHNLQKEINERKDNREQFAEKEIWYLLWSLSQALYELKQKGYNHKDLRPVTVALKRSGMVKLCPIGVLQDQKNSVARFVVENQQTYIPPTLKKQLINQSQPQINWNKIDSFALGHIILDLMIQMNHQINFIYLHKKLNSMYLMYPFWSIINKFRNYRCNVIIAFPNNQFEQWNIQQTDNQLLVEDVYYLLKPYSERINNLQDFQINFEDVKQLAIPLNNMSKLRLKSIIETSYKQSEILYESQHIDNTQYQQQLKVNLQQQLIIEEQKQQLLLQQQKYQQQLQFQQQTSNQQQQANTILQYQIEQKLQMPNSYPNSQTKMREQSSITQQIIPQPPPVQQQQVITQQQPPNFISQQQFSPQQHVVIPRPPQTQQQLIQSPDLRKSVSPQPQKIVNQQPQLLQRLLMQSQQIPQPQQAIPQIPPIQQQPLPISTPISPANPIKIPQQYYQPQVPPVPPPPVVQPIQNVYVPPQPPNILQQQPIQRPIVQQNAPVQLPVIYLNRPPPTNNYNQSPPGQKIPVQLVQTVAPMNDQYDREITVLEYQPQRNQPLRASNQVPQTQQKYSSPQTRQSNNFDRIRNVIQDSDELLQQQHK